MSQEPNNPYVRNIEAKNEAQQPFKVEYKTLHSQYKGQLDDEVSKYLNEGWMPHGFQYYVEDEKIYVQVMIHVPQPMMRPQ